MMTHLTQLDESTACRHLKSPQSLSGRSLYLTLVTKWSRSHLTLKIQMSKSWPRSNPLVTFDWGLEFNRYVCFLFPDQFWLRYSKFLSICLLFDSWQSGHFWQRYRKFHIWPWTFKVKVMAQVKPDDHIWGLEFNRHVCISFCGNRTIFGCDIGNSIFDRENWRSRSWRKSTKI